MQTASLTDTSLTPHSLPGAERRRRLGTCRHFDDGQEIFAEGEAANWFYRVESGVVRTSKLLSDGRRQIDAFHLAGDVFGIELGSRHRFSAEAVGPVNVVAFQRINVAASSGELLGELAASTLRLLQRAQDHLVLLGRKCARERVATFLIDIAERSSSGETIALPMSRVDIADHLGLTIETVCRILTELQRRKVIEMPTRRRVIVIRNMAQLRHLAA